PRVGLFQSLEECGDPGTANVTQSGGGYCPDLVVLVLVPQNAAERWNGGLRIRADPPEGRGRPPAHDVVTITQGLHQGRKRGFGCPLEIDQLLRSPAPHAC